jgi:hypothetical protein
MNRGTVELLTKAVTDAGQTLTFTQGMSAVLLQNLGPNTAYFADGSVAPTPSVGNGRYGLQINEILSLPGVNIKNLSFCCSAGQTASIQAVGMPSGVLDGQAPATAASEYITVDLNSLGIEPLSDGDYILMGPLAVAVPLAPYSDVVFDDGTPIITNAMLSLMQGDVNNTGFCRAVVQVVLDDPLNTEVSLFDLCMNVNGSGGSSGGSSVGMTYQMDRLAGMADLKAVAGATNIVAAQVRAWLFMTSYSGGTVVGAVSMIDKMLKFEANTAGAVQP